MTCDDRKEVAYPLQLLMWLQVSADVAAIVAVAMLLVWLAI